NQIILLRVRDTGSKIWCSPVKGWTMFNNLLARRHSAAGVFVVLTLMFAALPSLMAQTGGTGALTGTVTDASGAVVPNATVTAISSDTGQSRAATTGADGTYSFNLLPPGNYRLRFEATGIKSLESPSAT